MNNIFSSPQGDDKDSWISVSDLMAGLMMIFLLIAVIYAKDANQRAKNVTEIVTEWQDSELAIYFALKNEFEDDLPKWNAEIEKETLTIRFLSPEVLFHAGRSDLEQRFQEILLDFMPRYIKLLHDNFIDEIKEVRIEGHTSSEWSSSVSATEAFIRNMGLSQERTRTVLRFSMDILDLKPLNPWMRKTVSANGLSSAQLIIKDNIENKKRSRRVEFTIRTKTKEAMFQILDRVAPAIEKRI
ncbi:OmpA family protein [Candidatus Spongiihabitans sp.]|uniref:OmpA family protein n=1 Tax=Candidatus Spongiihabitans sp. TaxID=3101308 RepID=UPI003C6F8564